MKKIALILPLMFFLAIGWSVTSDVSARAYYSGRLLIKDPFPLNPNTKNWHAASLLKYYDHKNALPGEEAELKEIPIHVSAATLALCNAQLDAAEAYGLSKNEDMNPWIMSILPCQ